MNIQQFIDNPSLLETLTQEQKLSLFQQLQSHQQQLKQEEIKLQTELKLKQEEQQDLFKQLQQQTGKQTLPEIKDYITSLQQQFDSELNSIITKYQELQSKWNYTTP